MTRRRVRHAWRGAGVHALQASRRLLILLQLTHVVASTDGQYRAGAAAAQCKNPRRHVWRRSHRMPDNAALVDQMVTEGWLTDQRCIDVMKRVDRKDYVHPATPTSEIYEVRAALHTRPWRWCLARISCFG